MGVQAPMSQLVGPLGVELAEVAGSLASMQFRLVGVAAAFADSDEWIRVGSPTAAHWVAGVADVEVCTAREWIRIGRALRGLPAIAGAFAAQRISYSKVRTLTRVATADNEAEVLAIALGVPAGRLGQALAAWLNTTSDPEDLAAHQRRRRSVSWRTEADGMVVFTLRLGPLVAGALMALLTTWVMKTRPRCTHRGGDASAGVWPSLNQQYADAIEALVTGETSGGTDTEVVLHVRGDGCTLDDGTPLPESEVASLIGESFIRVLIHDAERRPLNASGRQRHPTDRQRAVVKERDRVCVDCGSQVLLEYDHVPSYAETGHTLVDELELRCAPCHRRRHAA